ncbi:hypothetical protein DL96DRAFT_1458832 [Flagelloscypha sp. PMI_526]|nr:hypothetical protein DL96DRAFT_1458832 [Flagelloscypha sp. PMI_526]
MSLTDRALTVRCAFDSSNKKISFRNAGNCSWKLLHAKIEQCFSLYGSPFSITYKDDDGEVCEIASDRELDEALIYFQAGDDEPAVSSRSSIISGHSLGSLGPKRITLRVQVSVDYDGRLSDTGSLISMEDYAHPAKEDDGISLEFGDPSEREFDDDEITISSKDTGSRFSKSPRARLLPTPPLHYSSPQASSRGNLSSNGKASSLTLNGNWKQGQLSSPQHLTKDVDDLSLDGGEPPPRRPPEDTMSSIYTDDEDPMQSRGMAWLREQEKRAIEAKMGPSPPSDQSSISLEEGIERMEGDLALEKDPRGRYYYSYQDSRQGSSQSAEEEFYQYRPTSINLSWINQQNGQNRMENNIKPPLRTSSPSPTSQSQPKDTEIPREYLEVTPAPAPTPGELTECSQCGIILDFMRYLCAHCDEKPSFKGKDRLIPSRYNLHSYPPSSPNSNQAPSVASSSGSATLFEGDGMSTLGSHFALGSPTHLDVYGRDRAQRQGYRLCPNCLGTVGVTHAVDASLDSIVSPASSPSSPVSTSNWLRSAPTHKGQRRHAYREQMWGHLGWEDVKAAESEVSTCSTCDAVTSVKRYKCAICDHFALCRACYGHVHDLHPLHPFLSVPDNVERSSSDQDSLSQGNMSTEDLNEEPNLVHPGVKCAHCMLDIVGARFHCAICPSVDICSNCESAGLPGNLHSDEGGHTSAHILIKIPYPLESNEVQTASRRAVNLWQGRDAPSIAFGSGSSQRNSPPSTYTRTITAGSGASSVSSEPINDHGISCSHCRKLISGTRYQCANCPSRHRSYNLCSDCEGRSHQIHDPFHVFLKFRRPVDFELASDRSLFPIVYELPAGPYDGQGGIGHDPKDYLKELYHQHAVCDRCMEPIRGCWFRCGYCPMDLCDSCEENDTHDETHAFLVFKAHVNLQAINQFINMEDPIDSPPILSQQVYRKSL